MLVSVEEYVMLAEGKAREQQKRYEIARFGLYNIMMLSPYIKQGKKPRSPQAFIPFPWDTQPEKYIGHVEEADVAKLYELYQDFVNRHEQGR